MASLNKVILESFLRTTRRIVQARRTRRIVVVLLISLMLFGVLGFFAAPPLIRHIAEQQLSQQLDRPATIGCIALNPYTLRFEADRIHIGEHGGQGDFVDVARLIVKPSWSSLFRAAPIIDEVQLDSPRFNIIRYDAQRFNFTDLIERFAKQPSKPGSKPTLFSISNIRLENGQINFDDRLLGVKHVIDHWKLGIPIIATLPSKTDIFVEPLLRARIDGSPLAIDGKTKPFAASRESEVSLRFDGLDVPQILSYAPEKLPVTVQSGNLSTNLKLNFIESNDAPSLRVTGTVDLTDVDVLDENRKPFFAAHALHVAAAALEPLKSVYHFDEIRINTPTVNLTRDRDGVLSVERTFTPAAAPAPAAVSPAKATAPLDLAIKRFALNDGIVNVQDDAAARPVALGLKSLAVSLSDFSTRNRTPAHYTVSTAFKDSPGSLDAAGSFCIVAKSADSKIDIKSLSLPMLQPYLDSVTAVQVTDGSLSATTSLSASWAKSPPEIKVGESQLDLQSLKLAALGTREPVVSLAQGQVGVGQVDVSGRNAEITGVDATGLVINAQRLKDGRIDLAALAGPRQEAQHRTAIHAVKKAQEQGAAWHYRIGELSLKDATANFTDNTTPRPVKLNITPLQLKVQQISDDLSQSLPIDLQATLNRKGTLGISGDVTTTPLKLALKVDAKRLDAAAFEPYFGGKLNATIASALLNMKGDVAVSQASKSLKASYRGDAALVDVRMLDKATSDPFAGWGALALTNLRASYDQHGTDVDAGRVTFSNFYARVLLDPQGKLNLTDVVAHESVAPQTLIRGKSTTEPVPLTPGAASEPPPAPATTSTLVTAAAPKPASASAASAIVTAAPPSSPVRVHFGQLVLQQGRVTYTDNFVKPNFTAHLVGLQGTVGAFGTQSTTSAPVDVAGRLEANGPLSIRGTVSPLAASPALDLTASAHEIELTNLTPYSAKYAGYPITKGKLNVDLRYKLDNDQLSANNHLFIDQLTFGDHIDNDTATRLPVRLAISLLQNTKGEIDVNIPVSGSLSNPEFSIGGLIWHAVLNLLEKAVTSPFSLLANAFGGNGEEMGYVEFEPGSAKLSDAADQKLDTIAKALADKPSIRIDLIGRADPAVDEAALRTRYVERLVRQEKIRDVVGNGESVDLSTVTVDPEEYERYLTKAYKDADFRKPRNFVGLTRTLPDDEMKSSLAEHAPINDASLRELAQRRSQSVQQYFEGKIDSSRLFIVAPKLDAQGIKDKGATTRVDFGLGM
ncbi:hypothetical protein R75461_07483 [Paraburkholderia nemoris]|uniref:DUF748 domain-containing protein n=1 Tax=Paraburkholderia nemoris TaxID=2793076 RepID=UPI00190C0462|nr:MULTISPECIES: DUF748 domain-containing protein [Paraburkholderia]MBK3786327.1 DUF748 domain-containing protein [Paraburkholderia aspalathi]CAE6851267.1 hypothetical protein R75461_07483 [Paraburkholderia nemoris]